MTSRENELLVCVARRSLNVDLVARMTALLDGELDWNYLCERATQHRLLPLLYHHLNSICPKRVPSPILDSMREEFVANSKSCLYLFSELRRLLRLFDENGIKAAVFKGPVLAATVYGDIGLRQVGDLDILIDPGAFDLAKQLLKSAGYRMEPALTKSQQSAHLRFHCEIQFVADGGRVVDLHWGLSPKSFPFGLDPDQVMQRAERVSIQSTSLLTFSPADMILYLCFHGSKHYWSRLEWINSLAEFIRATESIEWSALVDRAKASHSLRMLRVGLLLAQDFGELDLPSYVFSEVEETESLRKCAAEFKRKLFARQSQPPSAFKMFRYNWQLMDRKRDAIAGFLRAAFVPTISDWHALTLPGGLYLLYYLFRPFRLLRKYLSGRPGKLLPENLSSALTK
ncbi:MAG: nucleotidyltransferase domain-containing protein [Pyrinomonadaceae bacterium]